MVNLAAGSPAGRDPVLSVATPEVTCLMGTDGRIREADRESVREQLRRAPMAREPYQLWSAT